MHWLDVCVTEIRQELDERLMWIDCPVGAIPAAGQYALVDDPADPFSVTATAVYPVEIGSQGFLGFPALAHVQPGTPIRLRAPLGRGFGIQATRHLALAVFDGGSLLPLMPLLRQAVRDQVDIVLFSDQAIVFAPASVELYPLNELPNIASWADGVAMVLPPGALLQARRLMQDIHCQAQALVFVPMPCGALAECGVCAIPAQGGYRLACKEGPVFDWTIFREPVASRERL